MDQIKPFDDPITASLVQKRQNIAQMAGVHRLEPFKYLDMIGEYAERFGLDPDYVFKNSKFGTVTSFLISWKEKAEYQDRYNEYDRMGQQLPQTGLK